MGRLWRVGTTLTQKERAEHIRCRLFNKARMDYRVEPGVYAVGSPNAESEVLVSANYKMSFDRLRESLEGIDAWILVLDTKGINVWCAAGKGSFGTGEVVKRVMETRLHSLVTHRRLVLPQLGAPGVSAHEVRKQTGFHVHYGPVEARDIKEYLAAGRKAAPHMRRIKFPMADRAVLTPMEISPALKWYPLFALVITVLYGLAPEGILFRGAFIGGGAFLVFGLTAILSGAFLTPVLLPIIPSRSFAVKGWLMGLVTLALLERLIPAFRQDNPVTLLAAYLFFPLASSYIALQFTGSTTFTGMSGVKKELRLGMPLYLGALVVSVVLLVAYKIMSWGAI